MRVCSVEGCGKKRAAKGFCYNHWYRWKKYGDAAAGVRIKPQLAEWVLNHLNWSEGDCLIWPYGRTGAGYGSIHIDGKNENVHAVIATILYGPRPSDLHDARHICGNGHLGCVNWKHIVWGTKKENGEDRKRHGRIRFGESSAFAILSNEQASEIFNRHMHGETTTTLSIEYNVSRSTIWRIVTGRNWGRLTGKKRELHSVVESIDHMVWSHCLP